MNEKECVKAFIREFPEYKDAYDEHILANGALHVHMFFGEINSLVIRTGLKDPTKAEAYFAFVEKMAAEGDEKVKRIVKETILERLYDEAPAWEAFRRYAPAAFVAETKKEFTKGE